MTGFEEEQDMGRIQAALDLLSEHFDTVMVFATRHEPTTQDGTISAHRGVGNWFARYGQIKMWLLKEEENERQEVIESRMDDDE